MESWTGYQDYDNHRKLIGIAHPAVGLRGFIAIHRKNYNLALGGTRLYPYRNDREAITDVLRLSRGMGRKSAMAELPLDGGKIVLIGEPKTVKSREYLLAYGRILRDLAGQFVTGEDLNISMSDADTIAEAANVFDHASETESITIAGLSSKGGDPSPVTARGVLYGLKACLAHVFGTDSLAGRTVAIQGVGKVGSALAELVLAEGAAHIVVADTDPDAIKALQKQFGRRQVLTVNDPDEIYATACDVFAPCARGAVLNPRTIPSLAKAGVRIIAGSANNQLAQDGDGYKLFEAGIVYAPDYVINAGGLINVYDELQPGGYSLERVTDQVEAIGERIADIVTASAAAHIPTNKVANGRANLKIGA